MQQPPPARPGDTLDQIDTPALIVDLATYERNLARMVDILRGSSVRLRPHAKTHKSPLVAHEQIARGAVGVCCQKLAEAEVLAHGGIADILISNQIAGAAKCRRVAALARQVTLSVCCDHPDGVDELSAAAQEFDAQIGVLVEVEVGGARCGIAPGEPVVELARRIARAPGLRFAGLHTYNGRAQHLRTVAERRVAAEKVAATAAEMRDLLKAEGLDVPCITGGGTGTFAHDLEMGVLDELQAGSYIFMDADYAANEQEQGFEHALFVLATIVSAPQDGMAVADAGLKAIAFDSGPPKLAERPGIECGGPSDEHLILKGSGNDPAPMRGERIMLIPGHCDPTVNLHDWYVGIRDGRVERVWPVAGRGALA